MQNFITKLFQKFVIDRDIREFKKSTIYYIFFRIIRKLLNNSIEIKIHNFKMLASNKKNNASHALLRKCDFTDYPEKKLIQKISKTKKIFLIDCGSNFGFYSLFSASLSPENKIISLEASPKTFKDQEENIKLNNFKSIQLLNLAVSDIENEELKLNESKNDWESSISREDLEKIKTTIVKTTTIDSLLINESLENFNLILKLDVEGYECDVLYGASETIKKNNPLIIIEISKYMQSNKKYNFNFLNEFLSNFDYSIYTPEFKKISSLEIQKKLNILPERHFTIGNCFLVKKGSNFENLISLI